MDNQIEAFKTMTADLNGPRDGVPQPGEGASGRAQHVTLPAAPQAARIARAFTRRALITWDLMHLEEAAVLLVSELVANVVRHTQTGAALMVLRLECAGTCLRIEVEDTDPRWPQPRQSAGLCESGFGFVLVEALAGKWGVRETHAGKAVWTELDTRSAQ